MSRNQIRIDRLEIRLKGGDSNSAREMGAALGTEILEQIGEQTSVARNRRSIRIGTRIGCVDAGTFRVGNEARAAASSTAIARQIAARVSSKIAPLTSRSKG